MTDARNPLRPHHPYTVLVTAFFLTGMGQVLNGQAQRGLIMAFTAFSLAWVSYNLTTVDHSFVGRFAGGFLIHAIALMDAYKTARVRWTVWHFNNQNRT